MTATVDSKTCTRCGCVKPRSSFSKHATKPDGLQTWCKACKIEVQRHHRSLPPKDPNVPPPPAPATRCCTVCKVEKPLTTENFSKSSKGGFGFNARCKTCVSIESKAKYLAYGRREFAVTLVEKHCPRCNTTKAAAEFGRATFRTGGLTKHCLECEKFLRDEKGYYRKEKAERPEFVRERSRQWRQKNLEKARLQDREYAKIARKRKPEVFREIGARKRAEFGNARPPWADVKAIRAVYRKARELEKADGVRRHVDHIIPLRNTLVCGLHVQNNLQILTWEENLQKTNKFEIQ